MEVKRMGNNVREGKVKMKNQDILKKEAMSI